MKLKFSDILLSSDNVLLNNFILKLISKKIIPFHMKVEDEMLLVQSIRIHWTLKKATISSKIIYMLAYLLVGKALSDIINQQ